MCRWGFMHRYGLSFAVLLIAGCASPKYLHRDEDVVFFPTIGYPVENGREWVLPIHGWVYESSWLTQHLDWAEDATDLETYLEDPADRARVRRRIKPFLVDSKKGRRLQITLGDRAVRLSPTLASGHIYDEIRLPSGFLSTVRTASAFAPVSIEYCARRAGERGECRGRVYLLEPQGLSIVSDLDDTIRITEVNNTKRMLKNTFIDDFRAVPGMADLYTGWATRHQARFHYLSASPTQLARPIEEFLSANGFPEGSMTLRVPDTSGDFFQTMMDLFDAPPEYKLRELAWLMQTLPDRRYVLIGDSGQNDPEIYGAIAREFEPQVELVLIRQLDCCLDRDAPRYRKAFEGVPENRWVLFHDPSEVHSLLERNGPRPGGERQYPDGLRRDLFVRQLAAYK